MMQRTKITFMIIGISIIFLIVQYQFIPRDSFDTWNLPLTGKIIYLDPGHGGPDGGAQGGEAVEKEIALDVAVELRDYLQEQGALVLMTRERDKDLADEGGRREGMGRKTADLKQRLKMINESEADLFLSIHLNAIPSPRWRGAQTFYSPQLLENKRAANLIQEELTASLENTDREAKIIQNIYLLKNAEKPGALVEVGFLSNPEERSLLQQDKYKQKVAEGVYRGVMRYFTDEKLKE